MPVPKKLAFRTAAVVVGLVVAACLFEGAYSLATGRSLVYGTGGVGELGRVRMLDEERARAATLTPGSYAVPVDPYVGYRLKPGFTTEFAGVRSTTDSKGLRTRVGPPAAASAPRIVIAGDSVAFGYGVADDETFAHALEDLLASTLAPGAPRPVVRTAACPGWSFVNGMRFLLDHLEELAPDVVVFVPASNDLDDAMSALETGHLDLDLDIARGADRPHCSLQYHYIFGARLARRLGVSARGAVSDNPYALYGAVTPESLRRYGVVIDGLREIDARLRARGARFALALTSGKDPFFQRLVELLAERGVGVPRIGMFQRLDKTDSLPTDPHYNPRTLRAGAWRIARFLIDAEWVPGAGARPLPAIDERFADNVPADLDGPALAARRRAAVDSFRRGSGPEIDLSTGVGYQQVYGGVDYDGVVGRPCLLVLRGEGAARVELAVEPLAGRGWLYPMDLAIEIDGVPAGTVVLRSGGEGVGAQTLGVAVPEAARGREFVEVLIRPSSWLVEQDEGISRVAAFRLLSVAARP